VWLIVLLIIKKLPIAIQIVMIVFFNSVTKSLGVSFHPSDLFTLANLPDH